MRFTSLFPPKKFSDRNIQLTKEYIDFIIEVKDHRCIVFADEKPMREADSFTTVRRDPCTGAVPANISEKANVRFRYNIFAAVTVKKDVVNNVEAVVLDMIGDSTVFLFFVARLVQIRFLRPGDIFVVDNCSIHLHGVCEYLVDTMWNFYEILMLPLPPYSPELNPTELVFNTMASRIKSNRSRSELDPGSEFSEAIKNEFVNVTRKDVKEFYRKCRYNV
jgi:transposase